MNATTIAESQVLELSPRADHPAPAARAGGGLVDKSPVGIMMAAISSGATLEQFEKMMELQQRWEANEARKAFVQAMADFKAEPLEIFKRKQVGYTTKDGDFVGYKHAELSHIADVVVPAMARHGLSHRWDLQQTGGRIVVICTITHRLGHAESVSMDGSPDASGKKNSIQQVASTITYLQRYTLLAATGLATKDESDDDGRGGSDGEAGDGARTQAAATQPATYPDAQFRENLPKWREVIAAGRKTPDQIISMAQTKHPLTDEQKRALHESPRNAGPTYAHVADQLNKAANEDALNVAADLIKAVADAAHRTELNALFDKRRAELNA